MPFKIIRNDITGVNADAIVNTANPDITVGDGVDRAIYDAAGKEELLEERRKIGVLSPGEVGITKAFKLNAKYIIHVSGPYWIDGSKEEAGILRKCYDKALELAYDNKCTSIAFPLIASGTYGFPKELGLQIAIDAFTSFLESHDMEITLVVFGEDTVKISGRFVGEVTCFIDEKYEEAALKSEYLQERPRVRNTSFRNIFLKQSSAMSLGEAQMVSDEPLDKAIKNIYMDSFEKHLQQLINKKGLKNSEVYSAANISKQYFSKLLKGQVKPSKEKILALSVGLRLNMDEMVDFLKIAGYALSPISQTDIIVEYFIRHKEYNVLKIDIVLFDYGLDPLSGKN